MRVFILCLAVLFLFTTAQALDYDFEDKRQLKEEWEIIGGDWKIQNGVLRGQNAPAAGGNDHGPGIVVGEEDWTDYVFEFKMMVEKGKNGPGPLIRYQDPQNWYYFEAWKGKFFLRPHLLKHGVKDGAPDPIPGTIWEQKDFPGDGKWHDIKISAEGENIAGWVDGKQIWKYTFNKIKWGRPAAPVKQGLLKGKVGFTTWSQPDSIGVFDNVRITGPGIPGLSVSPDKKLATTWGQIRDLN